MQVRGTLIDIEEKFVFGNKINRINGININRKIRISGLMEPQRF